MNGQLKAKPEMENRSHLTPDLEEDNTEATSSAVNSIFRQQNPNKIADDCLQLLYSYTLLRSVLFNS